jgi:hypothetical protein
MLIDVLAQHQRMRHTPTHPGLLLCIYKSQRQASELAGGMWQMGHMALGNVD